MFCPYMSCQIRCFVLTHFVSLDALSFYVLSHYTLWLFKCFVCIPFVTLYFLSLYILSLYFLSFRRFVVIDLVVIRFVSESLSTLKIIVPYCLSSGLRRGDLIHTNIGMYNCTLVGYTYLTPRILRGLKRKGDMSPSWNDPKNRF
jgi:hypothetical protein